MPEKAWRVARPPWELVIKETISVELSVSFWRGRTRLDLEADLGLIDCNITSEDSEFATYRQALREVVYGGQRGLLPPAIQKRLERIERSARSLLSDMSFPTKTVFGNLMPKASYEKFVERLTQLPYDERDTAHGSLQTDFFAMRDRIVAERDMIAVYVRRSHRNLAVVAWRLSQGLPITDPAQAPKGWVDDYLDRVVAALPSRERIYASFTFDWTVTEIPVSDEAVKQVKLDELEREQARLDEEIRRLEAARQRVQSDAEYTATLEVERVKRQAERLEGETRLTEARQAKEKVERDLRIQREIGEKARTRIEEGIGPALQEITSSVRTMLYEATLNALAAVRKNDKLPPQTAGALKKLIARVEDLNWTEDKQIDLYLAQLREVSKEMAGANGGAQAEVALRETAMLLRAELTDLGLTLRSARDYGVPDEPLVVLDEYGGLRVVRDEGELPVPPSVALADAMEGRQARLVVE